MPRFSIIVPCFNAAATLGATLDSLRAQDFPDWEAILVDDGSTDATPALLAGAAGQDARIRWRHNPRRGPSAARNHAALAEARGEILAFCDADDLWSPDKLSRLNRAFADSPALDAAYGRVAFFSGDPARPDTVSTLAANPLSMVTLLGENPVCTLSNLAIRRTAFVRSGGFDEALVHNEDLDWLIRLAGQGARIEGLDAVLIFYRRSGNGLSANLPAMMRGRAAALRSAARFGVSADARSEAIFLRYLARRALRLDQGRLLALRLTLRGLATSPAGFLSDPRRGVLTALGAFLSPLLPRALRRSLFA